MTSPHGQVGNFFVCDIIDMTKCYNPKQQQLAFNRLLADICFFIRSLREQSFFARKREFLPTYFNLSDDRVGYFQQFPVTVARWPETEMGWIFLWVELFYLRGVYFALGYGI